MHIRQFLKPVFPLVLLALLLVGIHAVFAESDRINQVHHFGGDSLFCDADRGCWMVDINGQLLWEVPQSTIDDTMTVACETGKSQFIDAGLGTYGPNTLGVSCYEGMDPVLKLFGYDEWGKLNSMPFAPNYTPVNAPVSEAPTPTPVPRQDG